METTTSNLQSLDKDNPAAIQHHDSTDVTKIPAEPEMASGSPWQEAEVTDLKSTLATDVTNLDVGTKAENLQTKLETVKKVELPTDTRFPWEVQGMTAWNWRAVLTSKHDYKVAQEEYGHDELKPVIWEELAAFFSEFSRTNTETQDPSMTVVCHCTVPRLKTS